MYVKEKLKPDSKYTTRWTSDNTRLLHRQDFSGTKSTSCNADNTTHSNTIKNPKLIHTGLCAFTQQGTIVTAASPFQMQDNNGAGSLHTLLKCNADCCVSVFRKHSRIWQ